MQVSKIRSLLLMSAASSVLYGQGFAKFAGLGPVETAQLTRKLPPIVNVPGSTVQIRARRANSVPSEVADILITKTRAEILKDRERKFRVEEKDPEIILNCVVTGFELTEQRSSEQIGNQTTHYLRIIGNIEASIEVTDGKTGNVYHSDNLKSRYDQQIAQDQGGKVKVPFGRQNKTYIPTPQERLSSLVEALAKRVAQAVVPVAEAVEVPLPQGKAFTEIRKAAQAGRWGNVYELSEAVAKFEKLDDDSYRLYMQGLANEALAYTQAKETKDIQDYLSKAQGLYSQAKEAKRNERRYIDQDLRAQESVDHCFALQRATEARAAGAKPKDTATTGGSNEINNDYLISLKKSGRTDKFILMEIEEAAAPKFDVSRDGQDAMFRAGLSEDIVLAVRKKMRSLSAAPAAAPAPAPQEQAAAPAPPPAPAAAPAAAATPAPKPAARAAASGAKPQPAARPAAPVKNAVAPAAPKK